MKVHEFSTSLSFAGTVLRCILPGTQEIPIETKSVGPTLKRLKHKTYIILEFTFGKTQTKIPIRSTQGA